MWRCRAAEQFVLTISEKGYGKRTSSYEYRITGRGGKGIVAMAVNKRNGQLVASFPVEESDQIMLVTDGGQLIRVPVDGIRIAGRVDAGRDRVRHGRRTSASSRSSTSRARTGTARTEAGRGPEGSKPNRLEASAAS